MQSEITIYRNAAQAIPGTVGGADWAFPGAALTASLSVLRGDLLQGKFLASARWLLVWNPRVSDPASPTAVRLISCDVGPSNIQEVARVISPGVASNSPRVDGVDVTAALNHAIAGGLYKQLGHQTFGNGSNGCLIYASWLELVWAAN